MSMRHLKVRDPRHLLDSPPRAPDTAPLATPRDSLGPAPPASLAAVIMANSVEGLAPQPSRRPAGSEVEAAARKEERRPSEPVPKKQRLLQATEAEHTVDVKDHREDILAQAISAVGIDSNLAESEVEDLPYFYPGEGMVSLQYLKEVRPPPPGLPPPSRLRVSDPRLRPGFPPAFQTLEGPYFMRELRHPYSPYGPRPLDLIAQGPPQYRPGNAYPPHHYTRLPPPPSQTMARMPVVRPPDRHLPPRLGSPNLPRHFRPPPLHTSSPGPPPVHQTHEVHRVLAAPSHPPLPGSSPKSPSHLYPGGPLSHPDLKDPRLREVYVPVLPLPGAPYPTLHPRVPDGFTRLPYDPRTVPGREVASRQVVVGPRLPPGTPLSPRPVYPPDRLPGTESVWKPQPAGEDTWRPSRRLIEPPAPCVELIPIGPPRSSTVTTPSSESGRGSDSDNQSSGTPATEASRPHTGVLDCRRQSAPVVSDQPSRALLIQRSLSSGVTVTAASLVEARQISGRVVTNIIKGDRVRKARNMPLKRGHRTPNTCGEEASQSSTDSDVTIEKVVYIGCDGDEVIPHDERPTPRNDAAPHPLQYPRTCRPASEPPSGTMPPPATGRRPASVPAPSITSEPCPQTVVSEDATFTERLQLVLSDLVSVPGATQLQELSRSPARLLSTLVRRWGVQPSSDPNLQKRLRDDFKTMVQLCMPPELVQDLGWETCSSEEILTQLIQLSHNGEGTATHTGRHSIHTCTHLLMHIHLLVLTLRKNSIMSTGDFERRSSMSSSIPLDESLEDDVFSPSTPHSLPPTPQTHKPTFSAASRHILSVF